MVETNRRFNLTRITDPEAIVLNHLLDSLMCLWALEVAPGARVIDVGTGAGFPGVPIKIARPDLSVTLLDGTLKKVKFLSEAISLLSLEGIEPVHGRAEELAHEKGHRERYDAVYARALSELKPLAEMCLPFVRVGGRLVAQKGPEIDEELVAAGPMIGQLGGAVEKTVRTHIPGTNVARTLVVISKIKQTPPRYPRAYARFARADRRAVGRR
jgi:16S rRNA (guanine527-N7)-methyltransferase